jgi:hypothetical protein
MNSKTYFRDILTVVGLSIVLTILLTRPVFSQDTTKMKGDNKVRIVAKIVEDKNGKRVMDSAQSHMDRAFRNWGEPGNFHFRHNFNPHEFNFDYNYDFPETGEFPQKFLREFRDDNIPGILEEEHQGRLKGKDESLNDLLGDIPMDQVRSYSIRDTKDGKRIVIELNKEPFIEHHRDVFILRSPRPERMYQRDNSPQIKKKVIINNGDEEEEENEN